VQLIPAKRKKTNKQLIAEIRFMAFVFKVKTIPNYCTSFKLKTAEDSFWLREVKLFYILNNKVPENQNVFGPTGLIGQ
jgi:hypothetical protein